MAELPDLKQLTDEAKDALIIQLWKELQQLRKKQPKKTSKNSSLPPAKGFKAQTETKEQAPQGKRAGSQGRAGGGRPLSQNPDQIIKATVKSCQNYGKEIAESDQQLLQRYDKIDIPPILPIVTRVERYGCSCPHCGQPQIATVPVGMEPGSPFSDRIAALGSLQK
jgi:transposase